MNAPRMELGGYSVTDLEAIGTHQISNIRNDTNVIKELKKLNSQKKAVRDEDDDLPNFLEIDQMP